MKTNKLLVNLGKKYPASLSEKWDFPLHQIGKLKEETNTILLCLDFDEIVYKYMEENNLFSKVDLIITHHPFIFGKYNEIIKNDSKKSILCENLLKNNQVIYSYHTCFDTAKDGMNDALANELMLKNIHPLTSCPMARGGELEKEMNIYDFAKYAKEKLNINYGLLLPYGVKNIKTVAIIGGGGSGYFKDAMLESYDIYISGDCPHHVRRDIITSNYNYLDLPHEIEKIFVKQMKKILLTIDPTLNIIVVDHEKEPTVI